MQHLPAPSWDPDATEPCGPLGGTVPSWDFCLRLPICHWGCGLLERLGGLVVLMGFDSEDYKLLWTSAPLTFHSYGKGVLACAPG